MRVGRTKRTGNFSHIQGKKKGTGDGGRNMRVRRIVWLISRDATCHRLDRVSVEHRGAEHAKRPSRNPNVRIGGTSEGTVACWIGYVRIQHRAPTTQSSERHLGQPKAFRNLFRKDRFSGIAQRTERDCLRPARFHPEPLGGVARRVRGQKIKNQNRPLLESDDNFRSWDARHIIPP
jgi:hypothetical protein